MKAIIEVEVPDYQIGQEVSIYFKDTMMIKGVVQEPSGDLISRQAVLDLISNFILEIHTEGGRDLNAHTNDVLRQILRNVKSDRVLPPVNPQEPKTGKWIDLHRCWVCSECGQQTYIAHNYCPNCGCRMVEPQESEAEDGNVY